MKKLIKLSIWILHNFILFVFSFLTISATLIYITAKIYLFISDPVPMGELAEITVSRTHRQCQCNIKVPVDIIKAEIVKQAKLFGNNEKFMLDLASCESTFNNLADNPKSTAKGVYQFVANTWESTESNEKHISEFDYIANIREANIKIANREYSHWKPVCIK